MHFVIDRFNKKLKYFCYLNNSNAPESLNEITILLKEVARKSILIADSNRSYVAYVNDNTRQLLSLCNIIHHQEKVISRILSCIYGVFF